MSYKIKDSGERKEFESGMVRDVTGDKIDYTLVLDGPMFERWAVHLTKGAEKYDKRNWMKAAGPEELERFVESAVRHFVQWYNGEADEDHAAAVLFNMNGAEYVKDRLPKRLEYFPVEQEFPEEVEEVGSADDVILLEGLNQVIEEEEVDGRSSREIELEVVVAILLKNFPEVERVVNKIVSNLPDKMLKGVNQITEGDG